MDYFPIFKIIFKAEKGEDVYLVYIGTTVNKVSSVCLLAKVLYSKKPIIPGYQEQKSNCIMHRTGFVNTKTDSFRKVCFHRIWPDKHGYGAMQEGALGTLIKR